MKAIATPAGTIKYANIIEPYQYNRSSQPRYNVTLVFDDSTDITSLEEALAEKIPANSEDINLCLRKDGLEQGYAFARYLKASNKERPAITIKGHDLTQVSTRELENSYEKFVPGAQVKLKIRLSYYSRGNNRGVTAYLDGLFLLKEADNDVARAFSESDWD